MKLASTEHTSNLEKTTTGMTATNGATTIIEARDDETPLNRDGTDPSNSSKNAFREALIKRGLYRPTTSRPALGAAEGCRTLLKIGRALPPRDFLST